MRLLVLLFTTVALLLAQLPSSSVGGGGGGSSAFSAITAGTNTAALVIGTGGSLGTSGTGTIVATSCPTCTTSGAVWVFGGPAYSIAGVNASTGSANGGLIFMPTMGSIYTSTQFVYSVVTPGIIGAGIRFAYFNAARTAIVCTTTVGIGTDITAAGTKVLTWVSGTGVSGGVCTRPIGSPLVVTSDSLILTISAYYDSGMVDFLRIFNTTLGGTSTGNIYAGYTAGAISSGTGAALTFTADLSAIAWNDYPATTPSSVPVVLQK